MTHDRYKASQSHEGSLDGFYDTTWYNALVPTFVRVSYPSMDDPELGGNGFMNQIPELLYTIVTY